MRIAIIHVAQETNDFNPLLTTMRDFESFGVFEGASILEKQRGVGQVGGHIAAIESSGLPVESIPIIRAWATAGGRISRDAFDFFQRKMRDGLRSAGRIDGLALQLHGACAAEGIDDVEGEQIELCRSILGPNIPIVLGLDHHGNLTRKMVKHATAIVAHRTQPHDPFDTGRIGAELLLRIVSDGVRPAMAWRKIPLLSHQEQFLTSKGPMKVWFDRARAMEADQRVLHVANFPMQPWLDVDEGGWATLVVTDGDQALAEKLADESADLVWTLRDDFQIREAISIDEAVKAADQSSSGVVVLSDTGDTVFGGAAGDSNLILESMLRQRISGRALVPLIAPKSVARLVEAGVGATVTVPIGGEVATEFFQPINVTGIVRKIADGRISLDDNHQREIDMGVTVLFEAGPVMMLISELRGVAGNVPDVYRAFGVEPTDYQMAVLKTASNFQYFAPITSQVIRVDTKGPGQSDVATLPWRRLPRPIYPLERFDDRRAATRPPQSAAPKAEFATS